MLVSNNNSIAANDEDDDTMNWNLSGLAFIPILLKPLNGRVAIRLHI